MLANLLLFLTASVMAVTLLDFYMSDSWKKRLNDRVVRMWNWLDEAKRVPLRDMMRKRRSQRILAAVLILVVVSLSGAYMYFIEIMASEKDEYSAANWIIEYGTDVAVIILAAWLGIKILSMMLRGKTALQTFARASVAFVLSFLPVLLTVGIILLVYGKDPFTPNGFLTMIQSFAPGGGGSKVKAMVIFSGFGVGIIITIVLFIFWLPTAVLVLLIYLSSLCLYIVEITVRRIAEYPKGPLLAGSVVIGSVIALIKAFGGG